MEYLTLLCQTLEEAGDAPEARRHIALTLVTLAMAITPQSDVEELTKLLELQQWLADQNTARHGS